MSRTDIDNRIFVYKQEADYSVLRENREMVSEYHLAKLDELILPGDGVVIKPNWVKESHLYKSYKWEYIITNTEVIQTL